MLRLPQKTVKHAARVLVPPRDHSARVDARRSGALIWARGARSIKCGNGTVDCAKEVVNYRGRVIVVSRDLAARVDACGTDAEGTQVERGDSAVHSANEAV